MRNLVARLERFLGHPAVRLVVGLLLIVSGMSEVVEAAHEDVEKHSLKGAHGVVLIGLYHSLEAFVGVLKALLEETSGAAE